MIEFLVPLNLPVRAVAVTEPSASAPEWILDEMARWAAQSDQPSPIKPPSPEENRLQPSLPLEPALPDPPSPVEIELELLRQRRALFERATEELRNATRLVEKQLEGMLHELQLAAIEVAHAISAKLVFESVQNGDFPIENLVHEVITRLDTHLNTVVQLHPDDLAYIQQFPTISDSTDQPSLQFIPDTNLQRGDCKAKAGDFSVVYELKHQVEEIRRQLLSTVTGHAET